ncbi:thermonuclease family protein, partial [Candidatus Saccharibacteria bacterium]|nr:thermonuclease family protein [Candidatus Saccharibacteria bacterium]
PMKINKIMKFVPRKYRTYVLVILFASTLFLYFVGAKLNINADITTNTYQVTKVDDGDTIEVLMNGKTETIRFIGIDTPEVHDPRKPVQCFGIAASNFTKSRLENKRVRLESDPLSTNRDRYNRLLRYIYVEDLLLNAEIVQEGYGFANLGFPFTKSEEFEKFQKQAKEQQKGLWKNCDISQLDNGQFQTNSE